MKKYVFVFLITLGLSSFVSGQDKNQELYKAIGQGKVDQIEKLLRDGADANYTVSVGAFKLTMLNAAINVSQNKKIVALLLKSKADVNAKDAFNTTALMYAASIGDKEMVDLLLQYGADVKADDGNGNTVLSAAKAGKNKSIIKLIEQKLQDSN